jgi:hypothetical protein
METLISFIKSLIEESKSRLKNPFLVSYILVLLFLHWREVILFFDTSIDSKSRIQQIQSVNTEHVSFFGERYIYALLLVLFIKALSTYMPLLIDIMNYKGVEKRYSVREEIDEIKHKYLMKVAGAQFALTEKRNGSKELEFLSSQLNEAKDRIVVLQNEIILKNKNLEDANQKLNEALISNTKDVYNEKVLSEKATEILVALNKDNSLPTFRNIIKDILEPRLSNKDKVLLPEFGKLLSLGLIEYRRDIGQIVAIPTNELHYYFKVTDLGVTAYHISLTSFEFL